MAKWVDLGPQTDFPVNDRRNLNVDGVPLVVFHVDNQYMAIISVCPHAGMPLGEGDLNGKVLTCPFHGYAFNIQTGKNVDFPDTEQPVHTIPIRINEAGVMQADLELD